MGEINITKLINSIKIRPALYNKDDPMYYSNKKYKSKLWREVCEEVYRDWNLLAPHEKVDNARDLQKRWKSLRTCFTRELGYQKKEKLLRQQNEPVKKRKKYEYFNSLIFLLNPQKVQEYIHNSDSDSDDDPLEQNGSAEYLEVEDVPMPRRGVRSRNNPHISNAQIKIEPGEEPMIFETSTNSNTIQLDDKLLDLLKDTKDHENDEDRQFALSLVSIFKNLDTKKKLEARIEVLKVLQTIYCRNDDGQDQSTSSVKLAM